MEHISQYILTYMTDFQFDKDVLPCLVLTNSQTASSIYESNLERLQRIQKLL